MKNAWVERDLKEFGREWKRRGQAEDTLKTYQSELRKFFDWCPDRGDVTLALSDARDWLEIVTDERGKHAGRWAYRALRSFSKWHAEEYETVDSLTKLKCHKVPEPVKVPHATKDDLEKLLAACGTNTRDRAIILMLAQTGMRRAEVARMMWEDVDITNGTVTLPKTKNGSVRVVGIPDEAMRALRKYVKEWEADKHPYVWTSARGVNAGQLQPGGLGQMIERRGLKAGVDVRAHAFRRGFAGQWVEKGLPESLLQTVCGWKSPAMVKRYSKAVQQEAAIAAQKALFT